MFWTSHRLEELSSTCNAIATGWKLLPSATANPPSNDVCTRAIPVGVGTVSGDTSSATYDSEVWSVTSGCGKPNTAPGVWYSFYASASQKIQASTCSNSFDNSRVIALWGGEPDTTCGLGCVDFLSTDASCEATFDVEAEQTYYILVAGDALGMGRWATGQFELTIGAPPESTESPAQPPLPRFELAQATAYESPPPADPPSNDECGRATFVASTGTVSGSTSSATYDSEIHEVARSCGTPNTAPGVWYFISGNLADTVSVSVCGAGFGARVAVFEGSCGSFSSCPTPLEGYQSCEIVFETKQLTRYYILVNGYAYSSGAWETGDFDLVISEVDTTANIIDEPPGNDVCVGATVLTADGTTTLDSANVYSPTTSYDAAPSCDGISVAGSRNWYFFVGTGRDVTIETSTAYSKISVYEGSCSDLACVASGSGGELTFSTRTRTGYSVVIQEISEEFGVTIDSVPEPASAVGNDECTGAVDVSDPISGDTSAATYDSGVYGLAREMGTPNMAPGVWYRFLPGAGTYEASTCGGSFEGSLVAVFKGSCDDLEQPSDLSANGCSVTFSAGEGEAIYILVNGIATALGAWSTGAFNLAVTSA